MARCDNCDGLGVISPLSAFGMIIQCFKCSGTGEIISKPVCAGDHVCYFYTDSGRQLKTALSFIADGLRQKERCIYIADGNTPEEVSAALSALGIRVKELCKIGALAILSKHETYLKEGSFIPEKMLGQFQQFIGETLEKGFHALRATGEATWAMEDPLLRNKFLDYERLVNDYFVKEKPRFIGLCQYNAQRFPASVTEELRHAHQLVLED